MSRHGATDPDTAPDGGPPAIVLIVDGAPIEGTRIPLPAPGTPCVRVEVRLP